MKEAVAELYLQVKVRSDEEINCYNKEIYAKEKQQCINKTGFEIIKLIKASIEELMNLEDRADQASVNHVMQSHREMVKQKLPVNDKVCYSVLGTEREMLKRINMVRSPSAS